MYGDEVNSDFGIVFSSSGKSQVNSRSIASVWRHALVATACAASIGAANASTYIVGQLVSGVGAPANPAFAQLTVDVLDSDVYFTVEAQNLAASFQGSPYIAALAVAPEDTGNLGSFSGSVNSLVKMTSTTAGAPFVFQFAMGDDSARLTDGGNVSWVWEGGAGHFQRFAIQVEGLSYVGTASAWYEAIVQDEGTGGGGSGGSGVSPVPEPESGMMLLAGGLLLASQLRRKR